MSTRHAISFEGQEIARRRYDKVSHDAPDELPAAEPAAETNGEKKALPKKPATNVNPEAKAKAEPKPRTSPPEPKVPDRAMN
jgi:hypothetical protein